jgi:hypothetical protein
MGYQWGQEMGVRFGDRGLVGEDWREDCSELPLKKEAAEEEPEILGTVPGTFRGRGCNIIACYSLQVHEREFSTMKRYSPSGLTMLWIEFMLNVFLTCMVTVVKH